MPIRGFINSNIVACFTEPNQNGDIHDIDAPRNAPAKNPQQYMDLIQWHSDFFQYELAFPVQTININHDGLSGREKFWGPSNQFYMNDSTYTSQISYKVPGQNATAERVLFYHNLGYVPLAFVAYGGNMLMPGVAVQIESEGRTRFVSPFVTDSYVGLRELYNSTLDSLPAVSRTYQVMVFTSTAAAAGRPLFGREGDNVVIGRGKVDTSRAYLRRVAAGETSWDIDRGPTIEIWNGRTRIVTGGTVITEDGYNGGFPGPAFIPVGV